MLEWNLQSILDAFLIFATRKFFMQEVSNISMMVSPQSPDSRWVALDINDKIISEGRTSEEAISLANKLTNDYFLMFIPIEGNTYVF